MQQLRKKRGIKNEIIILKICKNSIIKNILLLLFITITKQSKRITVTPLTLQCQWWFAKGRFGNKNKNSETDSETDGTPI